MQNKHTKLSQIEQAQIKAFLRMYDKNESIPILPFYLWSTFEECGLTLAVYKKLLNKLAELSYIKFEGLAGSVSFRLTEAGHEWLAEEAG